MRQRFVQDDDCHWYLIPSYTYKRFQALIKAENNDQIIFEFDGYRCDSPTNFSFDNVLEDD